METLPLQQHMDRLIEAISQYVNDPLVLSAFASVPRHEFVPMFYDHPNDTLDWYSVTFYPESEQEWLQKVYDNRPLTTAIDSNGFSCSSSSQPSIMAQMLQSLHLQPGQRVLEIGTGTGYNAAILAQLVGAQNVTTIDINESLLDIARARIERVVGPGVTVLYADGRNLPADLAGFDAIIVAAGHDRVEPSWVRALTIGGRLVFNWSTSLTKVFLEAWKVSSTGMIGRVAEYYGDFMLLHNGAGVDRHPHPKDQLPILEQINFLPVIEDTDFRFFLRIQPQALELYKYKSAKGVSYALTDLYTGQIVHFFPTRVRGSADLWQHIKELHERFEELGSPTCQKFSLMVSDNATMTFVLRELSFIVRR